MCLHSYANATKGCNATDFTATQSLRSVVNKANQKKSLTLKLTCSIINCIVSTESLQLDYEIIVPVRSRIDVLSVLSHACKVNKGTKEKISRGQRLYGKCLGIHDVPCDVDSHSGQDTTGGFGNCLRFKNFVSQKKTPAWSTTQTSNGPAPNPANSNSLCTACRRSGSPRPRAIYAVQQSELEQLEETLKTPAYKT